MVAGAGLLGLMLLGMTLLVARSVTRQLRGMVDDMGKLAAGDFTLGAARLGPPGRDRRHGGGRRAVQAHHHRARTP
jgi:hypothetical protein